VVHTCNPPGEVELENCEFKASLDYIIRPCLKKIKNKKKKRGKRFCEKNSSLIKQNTKLNSVLKCS
jgi:hypothetical protein